MNRKKFFFVSLLFFVVMEGEPFPNLFPAEPIQ